ncbi:MAG: hypothetical protein JWR33_2233 [Naasia sp.]|uniref:purine-cytosine permease family protein n=1 Tax=Naasia sp. TaxID=2546198 RepID=UPI002602FE2F|nr:cytosine permease [Naasia sp.]MCU1571492.1 hypothetical protein [Naasia sp.]
MSDARANPGALGGGSPAEPAGESGDGTHDDDELAAALRAQLERFAPSGSIPIITAQRAQQYRRGEVPRFSAPAPAPAPSVAPVPVSAAPGTPAGASPAPVGSPRQPSAPAPAPPVPSAVAPPAPHTAPPAPPARSGRREDSGSHRRSDLAPRRRPEPHQPNTLSFDQVDRRFTSPVPHFAPELPPEPELDPQPLPVPPPQSAPLAPEFDPEQPPDTGALRLLDQLQERLDRVRLDEATYREWEHSLLALAEEGPADPRPSRPHLPSAGTPDFAMPSSGPASFGLPGFLPATRQLPVVPIGSAVQPHPDDAADDEVVDAELLDEDDDWGSIGSAAQVEQAPGGPVSAHIAPVPAAASAALVPQGRGDEPAGGLAGADPDEYAPLDPVAISPMTLDEGRLNTGSLPILSTPLDRDLDDDVDDVLAPQEALLADDAQAPVAPPLPGQDTGQVTPLSSSSVRTGAITITPQEQALPAAFGVEAIDLAPTPEDQRLRRPIAQFWLWFAPNTSALTLVLGAATIGLGLSLRQALVAAILGVALSCVPLAVNVLAAKRSGQPVAVVSRATFGIRGNLVPAALLLVVRLLWAGVLLWLIGSSLASLVDATGWARALPPWLPGIAATVVFAAVGCMIAVFGSGLISRVQLLLSAVSAVLVVLLLVLTAPTVDLSVALSRGDGSILAVIGGIVAVFSVLSLAWVAMDGELARYQQQRGSGTSTMAWAALGAGVPALVLIAWGAVVSASSPELAQGLATDPVAALLGRLPDWYPIPLLLVVVLGLTTALVTVLYSAGLTLSALGVRLGRTVHTLIAVAVAAAAAIGLLLAGVGSGDVVAALIPAAAVPVAAWTGMVGTELLLRGQPLDRDALLRRGGRYPDARWTHVGALVVIAVLGIGLVGRDTVTPLTGYLWQLFGVPPTSLLAQADLGVPLALLLGVATPLVFGYRALRRREEARS